MRIESLLAAGAMLGVLSVTGHAADPFTMAEPDTDARMRVCDVFGEGFFYIPGTETCLRISGEVYYQIGATSDNGAGDTPGYFGFARDGWNKTTKATINLDARSATEWGVLQGFIALESEWGEPVDGPVVANQAWLSLGGLRMGYSESAWADSIHDLAVTGSHSNGGLWYGDQNRHFIQYNFTAANGLFATLSLENDDHSGEPGGRGYVPDVVVLAGVRRDWGGVWARLGYDESWGDPDIAVRRNGLGVSAGLHLDMPNHEGSSFRLIGFYANGDHAYGTGSSYGGVTDFVGNARWSALGSYHHQFTPAFGASLSAQYFSDFYEGGTSLRTGLDGYSGELALVWTPVENFEIRGEAIYDKIDTLDPTTSGYLRFTRFF
jgi:hypothetical protein